MKPTWKQYAFWIALSEGVGAFSAWISRAGMALYSETVIQPPLSPPMWMFPVVWGILYALMGVSAARISAGTDIAKNRKGINLFVTQLILNFFWSPIFFNAQGYGLALIWLLVLWTTVLLMILRFRETDAIAAWLQVPYLLWLSFAIYLNWGVWMLN